MHLTVLLMFTTDLNCARVWLKPSSADSSHLLKCEKNPLQQVQFKVQKQDLDHWPILPITKILFVSMLAVCCWRELGMN